MTQVLLSIEDVKKASISEVFKRLTSNEKGLSSEEAERRLQQYGYNEIPKKKINPARAGYRG